MMTGAATELIFDPPGPGFWSRDPVHFPRPVTRYFAETQPEPCSRGTAEFMAFYGAPLGALEMVYVNGYGYSTMTPAPDEEIPERFARAEEVWTRRPWRDQLKEWDEVSKPASIARHRELQSVDPDELSDEELASYLEQCRDHHRNMIFQHMRFTGSAMLPVGDLLAHLAGWTTVTPADALAMLRGSAPVSAGASAELTRLIAAIQADEDARLLLESDGDPAQVLAELRRSSDDVGAAMSGFLDLVGYRLLDGFDIAGRYALELPDSLVRAIRSFAAGPADESAEVEDRIARIRNLVPEEHRAEFDELLGEARLMYRLRDERGVFSDIWASGIMRRAALGAGRRVAERGGLRDPEHMIDARLDEMCALVRGASSPSADEMAQRVALRTALGSKDAPPTLGPPPPPPPDPSMLPPGVARLMAAVGVAMGEVFAGSEAEHEENLLRGLAASGGVYVGTARRVAGPTEFGRIVQGDVLVTESTSEAFNILLPLLGAIVTDAGGLLSHSAIVAREYGIPGVVGTRDATDLIPDGARLRVDGDAGEVHVLS
jgi:pyruvate,water dikinase